MSYKASSHLNFQRCRLYREHKYLFHVFSELLQKVATADFTDIQMRNEITNEIEDLNQLLAGHAQYEHSRIHPLIKDYEPALYAEIEQQHIDQDEDLNKIQSILVELNKISNSNEITALGYELFLELRRFVAINLMHFDFEERVIMPIVQMYATDEQILEIDSQSYRQMTSEELKGMLTVLFPHFNNEDKSTFLNDIKACVPEKLEEIEVFIP